MSTISLIYNLLDFLPIHMGKILERMIKLNKKFIYNNLDAFNDS